MVILFGRVRDGAGATLLVSLCLQDTGSGAGGRDRGPGIVGAGGRDSAWGAGAWPGAAGAAGAAAKRQKIRRGLPRWYPHPKAGGCLP